MSVYQIKPWSYSSIKTYETCPRKYQAEKVTKEVPFTDSDATIYGKEVHKVCEDHIKLGVPIPQKYSYLVPIMQSVSNMAGVKHTELELGIAKQDGRLVACEFHAENVWFRGIADLVIINGDKARILDYKTSKSAKYADTKQLALMAAAVFLKFPEVQHIKAGLVFVVCNAFIPVEYSRDRTLDIFADLDGLLQQRESSYNTGVFNPKPNALCRKWCGVHSCPHNGIIS